NAWLLYRRYCTQLRVPEKKIMSLLTIRVNTAEALLKSSPLSPVSAHRGRPSLQSIDKNNPPSQPTVAPNPAPTTSVRFDKYDHWPVAVEKGRCRNPGCMGYSRISCSKCKLCRCLNKYNNLFKAYHHH
ncbi:unnamed protein product, partial [Didymodactylos carnosus]